MENSAEIIEAVRVVLKERAGKETVSDYAVSKALHISRQAMSQRKHGHVITISDETAVHAAAVLGVEPSYLLAIVHAELSDRAKQIEAAATWRNLAEILKTGKRAAMVAGFFLAGAVLSVAAPSKTAVADSGGAAPSPASMPPVVYYVKSLASLFSAFLGLFRHRPRPVFGC